MDKSWINAPITSDTFRDGAKCFIDFARFRTLKHRFKKKLFKLAAKQLDEHYNIANEERQYSDDELLDALDLIEIPANFVDPQWELYKAYLRSPASKKLSQFGKKARAEKLHTHTTGAKSFARKKDEFRVKNKRDANDIEFFEITYVTKKGSYVEDATREFMDQACKEVSKKILDIGGSQPIEPEIQSEVEREIMIELMGPDKSGRGYGAGVTKSQSK